MTASTDDLARRLNSATVHLGRALRRDPRRIPQRLATEHASALSVVVFAGALRIGDLAKKERVGAPAMTKTVFLLQRAGLVRRVPDKTDGRARLIRATARGSRLVLGGRDERVRQIAGGLEQLSAAQRDQLLGAVASLEELIALLELDRG